VSQYVIVGNTLASLIAAYELARQGKEVTLIKHKGGWGGHFSGLQINGEHFDAGMTIVELTSTNLQAEPDLASYDSLIRNDVGRFFGLVKKFVSEHFELREIEQPQSYFRGGWSDDFLLCNSFALFDRFSAEEKALIVKQLESRDSSDWQHASQKIILQAAHTAASYQQTSIFNHGELVHQALIDPFVKKLTGSGSENIASIFHRRLWAPLYYPETIAQAAKGELDHFGGTIIHYPSRSSFNGFARGFIEQLNAMKTVTLIEAEVEQLDTANNMIVVEGVEPVKYKSLAWGGALPECQRLLGLQPIKDTQTARANLGFEFLQLDSKKILKPFSIAFVFDENIPFYRVSNQSYCASIDDQRSKLIVEYNTDYLHAQGFDGAEALSKATVSGLIEMGIINDASAIISSDVKIIPRLLPLPTMQYYECARQNIEMVQSHCPDIALMGDSTSIASRSFADHIVQGLQYAHSQGG
jgi:protoporphyrinogen oxidase